MVKSREEHALSVLSEHDEGLSKSQLAYQLYGEVTGSTQALISRLTKHLLGEGHIEESKIGRRVIVRLSPKGGEYFARQWKRETIDIGSLGEIQAQLQEVNRAEVGEEHPWDRPLVYLAIAARLSARRLAKRTLRERNGDMEFGRALLAIIDPFGDGERKASSQITNSGLDRELFGKLASTWPSSDPDRLGIIESIIRFQDPSDKREGLAADLLRLGTRLPPGRADSLLWLAVAVPEASRIGLSYAIDGDTPGDPAIRNALFELVSRHIKDISHYGVTEKCLIHYQKGRVARSLARMTEAKQEWHRCHEVAQGQEENTTTSKTIKVASRVNAELAALDSDEWDAVDELVKRWPAAGRYIYERETVPVLQAVSWAVENKETLRGEWYRAIAKCTARNRGGYVGVFESLLQNFKTAGIEHRWRICTYINGEPGESDSVRNCRETYRGMTNDDQISKLVKSVLNNNTTTPMIWGAIAASEELAAHAG